MGLFTVDLCAAHKPSVQTHTFSITALCLCADLSCCWGSQSPGLQPSGPCSLPLSSAQPAETLAMVRGCHAVQGRWQ